MAVKLAATTGREKLDLMKQIVALHQPPTQPTDTQDPTLETFTAEDLIPDGDDNMVKTAKGTADLEAFLADQEAYSDTPQRQWQVEEKRLLDPAGGSEVIEAWDSAKADSLLESAMVADPNIPPIPLARQFIESHLQGRIVKTAEGDCIINSWSKGELSLAANRYGKVKLHCILRIPEILINGESLGLEKLKKERRDKIIGFYPFRHIVEFKDGLKADVELRVGKREGDGLPLVYSMDAKWLTLDSVVAQKNGTSFIRYPVGQTNTHSVYRSTIDVIMDASDSAVNAADDVNNDDDSMNIRILAVWDKDGNRLPEFEDDQVLIDHSALTETDPNVALLQDIAQGQYSHLNSEALLDMIEPAARALGIDNYAELIDKALLVWLDVDNKAFALDSVYREAA